ncbi:MAG: LysE family translocator [Methyloligellaceae bacterium]
MSVELFLAFLLAAAILAATPGPNVSLIIANGTSFGLKAGLLTVAGGISGVALLATGATLGMGSLMVLMADWFDLLRWAGAAYLVWLGISRIWKARKHKTAAEQPVTSGRRWYWQGLAVSLSNPKTLLFLGALFPQFVNPDAPLASQLWLLAVTFIAILALVDSAYAVVSGTARAWITQKRVRLAERITGFLLILGGVWLAAARRV